MYRMLTLAFLATLLGMPATARELTWPLQMEVVVRGETLPLYYHSDKVYIEAQRNQEYAIRLRNRSDRRLAVALSVDGLNTIDAKHDSAKKASKWVIAPWETITISGWQVDQNRARRFYFTTEDKSYGAALGRTENLGIISAVVFREKYQPIVEPREYLPAPAPAGAAGEKAGRAAREESECKSKSDEDYAATGMGQSTDHRVTRVRLELEPEPCQRLNFRYEYRDVLVKLGVLPAHKDRLYRREQAQGFKDGGYCPELPR